MKEYRYKIYAYERIKLSLLLLGSHFSGKLQEQKWTFLNTLKSIRPDKYKEEWPDNQMGDLRNTINKAETQASARQNICLDFKAMIHLSIGIVQWIIAIKYYKSVQLEMSFEVELCQCCFL